MAVKAFSLPEGANLGLGVHIHWTIDSRAICYVNTARGCQTFGHSRSQAARRSR
jgi:hypothetical protein